MMLLYPEPTIFTQHILLALSDKGNIPCQLTKVIDPPSYDLLEQMIVGIENKMW